MHFHPGQPEIEFDDFKIVPSEMIVRIDGQDIELTMYEISALYIMSANPGRVYARRELISEIFGDDHPSGERSLDKMICLLRKKTGIRRIKNVRGVGYKVTKE